MNWYRLIWHLKYCEVGKNYSKRGLAFALGGVWGSQGRPTGCSWSPQGELCGYLALGVRAGVRAALDGGAGRGRPRMLWAGRGWAEIPWTFGVAYRMVESGQRHCCCLQHHFQRDPIWWDLESSIGWSRRLGMRNSWVPGALHHRLLHKESAGSCHPSPMNKPQSSLMLPPIATVLWCLLSGTMPAVRYRLWPKNRAGAQGQNWRGSWACSFWRTGYIYGIAGSHIGILAKMWGVYMSNHFVVHLKPI